VPTGVMTTDARGKYLYIAQQQGLIAGYMIDPSTGSLRELPDSPYSFLAGVRSMMPSLDKLYAVNERELRVYDVGSGSVFPVNTPAVPVAPFVKIGQDSTGEFLYVGTTEGLLPYIIKRSGRLIPSCVGLIHQDRVGGMAAWSDSDVSRLYVSGNRPDRPGPYVAYIYGYVIDQSSGDLRPISGSPWRAFGESTPGEVAIESTGTFLYTVVINALSNRRNIRGFLIDASTGSLTLIEETHLGNDIVSDWTGPYLYATDNLRAGGRCANGCGLHVFRINQDTGELTELPDSPFRRDETIGPPVTVSVFANPGSLQSGNLPSL
jgi:6-phosphogluconolactonase (cycloisomerase 2 family)